MIKAREPKLGRPVWLSGILPLLVAGGLFPAAAQAAWSVTLYANNQVDCSDAQGTPYCTIGAAVAVANPGDTVAVAAGTYLGQVLVKVSGVSEAPIVISTSSNA